MAQVNRRDGRYQSTAAAFLAYLAFSILMFGRGLSGHLATAFIGRDADPYIYVWYLRWWRHAIDNFINPFFTDMVWAPRGFNLAWTAFIPLPAWIAIPIDRSLGETAAYNILCIFALPLAAVSAFLLCRRVTGAFWPSILGGYIFGFSSYMLGELLGGHLNLTLAFSIPLELLVGLRRLEGEIGGRRFTLEIAVLLVAQFLCGIELFATMTVFAGFTLLSAIFFFDGEMRARLIRLIGALAAAYAIAMVVVSPYLYYLFALGSLHSLLWPPALFTGDLLNFFIPTETNLLGTFRFARTIAGNFRGNIYENGVYIGIPLIIVVEAYRRMNWRTPAGKFLITMLVITVVASFGPVLRMAGRPLFPMPWAIFAELPLLSGVLAVRLALYSSLVVSLIASIWFSSATARPSTKCCAAILVAAFFAPNPSSSFWISPIDVPAFFTDGTYANELEPREIVLPLPFPRDGKSMYWQARSGMYFRMAGGWTVTSPFEFVRMPIVNYFLGEADLPEPGDQLKAYLAQFAVTAIVADPSYGQLRAFQPALESLGVTAKQSGGVLIYKIPRGKFLAYAKLTGAEVEARAIALRFDTILAAAADYVAGGNDPLKISPLELKRLDLLPPDWQIDNAADAARDWSIAALADNRIAIVLLGSMDGMKGIIDRYFGKVDELDYPAPSRWDPSSSPANDRLDKLLMIVNRTQLETAAGQLRSSPPPEMTTTFLGAASR